MSQCHAVSVKKSCGLFYVLLLMLSLIIVLGKRFLKILRAVS